MYASDRCLAKAYNRQEMPLEQMEEVFAQESNSNLAHLDNLRT